MMLVEDHGNGFMVIGTNRVRKARKVLKEFVEDPEVFRFACPTHYEGFSSVWLATEPGQHWDGAVDHCGTPMRAG